MMNFDMVGRLNAKDELTIMGTGSTPGAGELVDALGASAGFKIKKIAAISDGMGGSDHESFYPMKIPVLFAFTGVHSDYHKPSDDSDKINYRGMARIADLGELLLLDIARRPTRPEFTRARGRRRREPRRERGHEGW
jgi:Zn-dependent M28 family amino/carboxypeptidase